MAARRALARRACCKNGVAPGLPGEHHLARLGPPVELEADEVGPGGERPALLVPAFPPHLVPSRPRCAVVEERHLAPDDVVDRDPAPSGRRQVVREVGRRRERIGSTPLREAAAGPGSPSRRSPRSCCRRSGDRLRSARCRGGRATASAGRRASQSRSGPASGRARRGPGCSGAGIARPRSRRHPACRCCSHGPIVRPVPSKATP